MDVLQSIPALDQLTLTCQGKVNAHELPYLPCPLFHATIAITSKIENKIKNFPTTAKTR
jgi:hypothetical protein